jgi:ParB-like chromosome segregation protein Spo0J
VSERATSIWVPIERVVPHPDNPNKMDEEEYQTLRANVEATGLIPPAIVRSLEESETFTDAHDQDVLQLLDGENRWRLAQDLGRHEFEVRVWKGITDERAKLFLATLNRIHGKDDKTKRATLLRSLADAVGEDYEELASVLPESADDLKKFVEEQTREAVSNAQERAAALSQQEPLTVFCTSDQARVIRSAIDTWLGEHGAGITECREGAALAALCGAS